MPKNNEQFKKITNKIKIYFYTIKHYKYKYLHI